MTKKKHLYEVDLMRCFFMFGVVLNHVASTFAAALGNKATPAGRFLVSTHLILHFPRFSFMFITGLVLFLGYWGRPEKKLAGLLEKALYRQRYSLPLLERPLFGLSLADQRLF
jgi:uncharacterized membrane protein